MSQRERALALASEILDSVTGFVDDGWRTKRQVAADLIEAALREAVKEALDKERRLVLNAEIKEWPS